MDIGAIQAIVAGSNSRVTWSLSLICGSLVAVLSTSFLRPMNRWSKLIYLLFIPGWIYLAYTIKWGDSIARRGILATIAPDRILVIADKMNDEFVNQLEDFNLALIFFGIWLLLYLMWWILNDFFSKTKNA